jgi:hypothetical protein
MLHILPHPDWLLAEVLKLYPAWADRTPETTPFHLHGYGCGGSPSNWTGGPYRGWDALRGSERLLHGDPMMRGPERLLHGEPMMQEPASWHPAWRLWERNLDLGWTREMEEIAEVMWRSTGRRVEPLEMGVPAELHVFCRMEAWAARDAMDMETVA